MIITYNAGRASSEIALNDWQALRWRKKHDTYIIDYLWDYLKKSEGIEFRELYCSLIAEKKRLKNDLKIKSRADIIYCVSTQTIDIINKGVLPNILIQKA